jgi:hypothetical protein
MMNDTYDQALSVTSGAGVTRPRDGLALIFGKSDICIS